MAPIEHMRIRPAAPGDVAAIAAIYNHYVGTSVVTFDTDAKSVDERVRWLSGRSHEHPVFVAEADGTVIAWGALSPFRSRPAWAKTAEAAIYVDAAHIGRGVGSSMLARLIAEARSVGLHVLVSQIVSENTASLSMTERAGFVRVGTLHEVGRKFDRWLDVVVLELVLGEEGGMAHHHTFDISKLEKLNNPGRLETIKPTAMWSALGSPEPDVIVEIGAGTGLFATAFAALAPASTVYAADSEPRMIDWMRENRPDVSLGRVVPVASTETSVPLDDRIADIVAMVNVHHELADPDAIYAEALRLLSPGGKLLVVDWAPRDTPKGPPLAVRATAEELRRFLERAGFEQIEEHEDALVWHTVVTATRPI